MKMVKIALNFFYSGSPFPFHICFKTWVSRFVRDEAEQLYSLFTNYLIYWFIRQTRNKKKEYGKLLNFMGLFCFVSFNVP